MNLSENAQKVNEEVKIAYADCHMPWEKAKNIRNLDFHASFPLPVNEAIHVFKNWCKGYNAFYPDLLKKLPEDTMVIIAREGSPCIYIINSNLNENNTQDLKDELEADEFFFNWNKTGQHRIWWD